MYTSCCFLYIDLVQTGNMAMFQVGDMFEDFQTLDGNESYIGLREKSVPSPEKKRINQTEYKTVGSCRRRLICEERMTAFIPNTWLAEDIVASLIVIDFVLFLTPIAGNQLITYFMLLGLHACGCVNVCVLVRA